MIILKANEWSRSGSGSRNSWSLGSILKSGSGSESASLWWSSSWSESTSESGSASRSGSWLGSWLGLVSDAGIRPRRRWVSISRSQHNITGEQHE